MIPVGPFHPILEEPEFYQLYVEGEKIVDADVRISYNHRGIEKLSEGMTFDQVPFLVARICGICCACHPFAYVNAMDDLLGIEPPERAKYIRTIFGELERIHSHLLWVGLAGHFIGYNTVFMWAWRYREPVLDICEFTSGNRNHYDVYKVGGVRFDVPDEQFPAIRAKLDECEAGTKMLYHAVLDDPILHLRLKGIGVLTKEDATSYCTAGPTARGSGLPIDTRADEPYAAYDLVDWNVVVHDEGDVMAKALVRMEETLESISIVRQCLDNMRPGPIEVEVEEIPAGEGIGHTEAPRGETFHYVRSDGGNHPVRHKIRAPSYVNVPSFKANIIGAELADAMLITAANDPCYSCTERVAAVDWKTGDTIAQGRSLIELCQEKTKRIKRALKR
jgi:NADH-quinone oxidoreductase subunit D